MNEALQKAKYLAQLVLRWHQEIGKIRVQQLGPQIAHQYMERLGSIQMLSLNEPKSLHEIANEQIKGVFERFYTEQISEILRDSPVFLSFPGDLGEAATMILDLLKDSERSEEATYVFMLPEGWQETPIPLYPAAVQVPQASGKTASQTLQDYFASLLQMNDVGLGGRELMVAMNEDYGGQGKTFAGYMTVYNPASFSFQLGTGADTLVTLILQGKIQVGEVMLGTSSNNEEVFQQEGTIQIGEAVLGDGSSSEEASQQEG